MGDLRQRFLALVNEIAESREDVGVEILSALHSRKGATYQIKVHPQVSEAASAPQGAEVPSRG